MIAPSALQPRVEDVAQTVGHQVDGHDENEERYAGVHADPVSPVHQMPESVGDEQAQGRFGDGQAQTEEGQGCLKRDGVAHLDGDDDQKRGKAVGEYVLENDAPCGHGQTCGGFHIFLVFFVLCFVNYCFFINITPYII